MADSPYMIGLAGGTGAGKTTIARETADSVDMELTHVSLDSYYRDRSAVPETADGDPNFDHPDAIDWELFVNHVTALANSEAVMMPQYDFDTHARKSTGTEVEPAPIVVVEGIFALYHDRVVDHLDLSVYVETDADERVLRRIKRDTSERGRTIDGVIEQYRSTVKPMHERFVEPTKRNADIIIPGGTNPAAIDLLREKVKTETDARTLVADASD